MRQSTNEHRAPWQRAPRPEAKAPRRSRRPAARWGRALTGLAALGIFGVAVVALAVTIAIAAGTDAQTQAAGNGPDADGWIALRSTSPSDILAAVSQSPLLAETSGDPGSAPTPSAMGTPLFVHGMPARSGVALPDVYVVPLLNGSGKAIEAAEAVLNPTHKALHVTTVVTFTRPRSPSIVAMSASGALAQLERARHVRHLTLLPGSQPTLVYFPMDAQPQTTGAVVWRAGGEDPADPIWLFTTSDGHQYVVGTNGAVYTPAQLPLAASA